MASRWCKKIGNRSQGGAAGDRRPLHGKHPIGILYRFAPNRIFSVENRAMNRRSALNKVACMKTDPKNPQSPTFGQRIRQGKLPGNRG